MSRNENQFLSQRCGGKNCRNLPIRLDEVNVVTEGVSDAHSSIKSVIFPQQVQKKKSALAKNHCFAAANELIFHKQIN
jgi:hypothetical protein